VNGSGELIHPGQLLVSDLVVPSDNLAIHPAILTLVSRVTIPLGLPAPSPALIKAGDAAKVNIQLLQHLHTISAHVPPEMPLSILVQLVVAQAAAASEKVLKARHEFLQVHLIIIFPFRISLTPQFSSTCLVGHIV
jgi:hypothetical protein